MRRQDRSPLRRGDALAGGQPPRPETRVHRRSPRLRAGVSDRVFRRRPGQLQLPALRSRHGDLPCLRKDRPSSRAPPVLEVEPAGPKDGDTVFDRGTPRQHRTHADDVAAHDDARRPLSVRARSVRSRARRRFSPTAKRAKRRRGKRGRTFRPGKRPESDHRLRGRSQKRRADEEEIGRRGANRPSPPTPSCKARSTGRLVEMPRVQKSGRRVENDNAPLEGASHSGMLGIGARSGAPRDRAIGAEREAAARVPRVEHGVVTAPLLARAALRGVEVALHSRGVARAPLAGFRANDPW